jgi:hypothetical protein
VARVHLKKQSLDNLGGKRMSALRDNHRSNKNNTKKRSLSSEDAVVIPDSDKHRQKIAKTR